MKKIIILLTYVLFVVNAYAVSDNDVQKEPFLTQKFPASSIKSLEVHTAGGNIEVTGGASSEAIVDVFIDRKDWSNEKIKAKLDENYTLEIKIDNGQLYVSAKAKHNIKNWKEDGLSISFKISVPNQVNSQLHTSGGSIKIGNLSGSQDIHTSGGSLQIENISGKLLGKTSGGSINVSNAKDDIDLSTSGGSITAEECKGNISLKTSGGGLNLKNLKGTIEARTSGGSVKGDNINGTLTTSTSGGSINLNAISGSVEASTSGGSISVEMQSVNEFVKLSNSGSIRLKLPEGKGYNVKVKGNGIAMPKDFRGNANDKSMEGTIGNGGPLIEVKSSQRVEITF